MALEYTVEVTSIFKKYFHVQDGSIGMYCDDSPDLRDVQLEVLCSEAKQDTAAGPSLVIRPDLPAEETSQEVAPPLVVERGFCPRKMFSQRTDTRGNHSWLLLEA